MADARVEDIIQRMNEVPKSCCIVGESRFMELEEKEAKYDKLLEALKGLLPWIDHEDPGPGESGDQFRNDLAAARAALGEE